MEIVLVGLNHRTASLELRERVSFTAEQARRAADELRSRGLLEESLVLSTCNRSEVYGVPPEASHECAPGLSSFLSEFHSIRPDVLNGVLYQHYDPGPVLNRLFQGALETGKRVRSETELGTRPMSVAAAGVKLAERIFGKLADRSALVVSTLRDRGIAHLHVMNRSRDKAQALATQFGGRVIEWGNWDAALSVPDVVVSSVSSEEPVLTRRILEHAMAARSNRAFFVMDLGVPRNIDPAAAHLYNLYVYNIDDLTEIVEQNRNARESEVPRAEVIVEEHVGKFLSWQASVELVGLVEALRSRIREERAAFIRARLDTMNHLAPGDRQRMETLMDELLEKLLVQPAERLRGEKELRRKIQNVEALRDLFLSKKDKP